MYVWKTEWMDTHIYIYIVDLQRVRETKAQRGVIFGSRAQWKVKTEPGFEFKLVKPGRPNYLQKTRTQKYFD